MISSNALADSNQNRIQSSRSDLIAAYKRVIKTNRRRQATDLHVRRLLSFVQAKEHDGQGVQRSLEQVAKILFLTVSTTRRVIRRAVKHFGLLTVTQQRHTPGGQTVNRYSINWSAFRTDSLSNQHEKTIELSPPNTHADSHASAPGDTDMPVRLALPVGSSDLCSEASTDILKSLARSKRIPSPGNTDVPVGSSAATSDRAPANEESDMPGAARTCPHTSLPNAMCASCHDAALASGIKRDLGWIYIDPHADLTIYYDQPPPPHLNKVFDRLARTPRPSSADLTPRGQTPPFPIVLPQGLPAELLAHIDTLLAKSQAAIDCAQRLCPKRRRSRRKGRRAARLAPSTPLERLMDQLKYRLFSLLFNIEATQFRASNPAMCRTYLPPINLEPPTDFAAIFKEMASTSLQPDFSGHDLSGYDFSQHDLSDFDFSQHDMSNFDFSQHDMSNFDFSTFSITTDALSNQPPVPTDHPSSESPRPSSSSAVKSLDSLVSKIESVLTAIDDLLAAIKAALRCARAHRISWLKKHMISWQRCTKTIRARMQKALHSPSDTDALKSRARSKRILSPEPPTTKHTVCDSTIQLALDSSLEPSDSASSSVDLPSTASNAPASTDQAPLEQHEVSNVSVQLAPVSYPSHTPLPVQHGLAHRATSPLPPTTPTQACPNTNVAITSVPQAEPPMLGLLPPACTPPWFSGLNI